MRLEPLISPERTVVLQGVRSRDELLERLAALAAPEFAGVDAQDLVVQLRKREDLEPTSLPEGVAFPHALLAELDRTVVVAAVVKPGVRFGNSSHPPSDVVFAMFGSAQDTFTHLRLLARLARIARGPHALENLRKASDGQALFEALVREDRTHG